MSEFRRCPFCGSEVVVMHETWNRHTDHKQGYSVECYDCGCTIGLMTYHDGTWDAFFETEDEAVDAWNKRVCDRDALLALADELEWLKPIYVLDKECRVAYARAIRRACGEVAPDGD